MKVNFDKAFDAVISVEGGYVNDPDDPGGETKFGISKRAYPHVDIPTLTLEDAKEIYRRDYWVKAGSDDLAYPLDILVFDAAVNMGRSAAKGLLAKSSSPIEFTLNRIEAYADMKNFKLYGHGWVDRTIRLYRSFCPAQEA